MMVRQQSLASALLRQLIFVALIPVGVTLLFVVWLLYPQLKQDLAKQQQTLATILANQSYQHIESAEQEIQFLARSLTDNNARSVESQIQHFIGSSSTLDALYLLSDDNLIQQISVNNMDNQLANSLYLGADLSRNELILNHKGRTQPYWSNTFHSLVTARLSIAYMVPRDRAMIVAEIAIDRMPKLSQSLLDDDVLVMILDEYAQLIAHPDPEQGQQQLNLSNLPFFHHHDTQTTRSAYFTWNGNKYFGTAIWLDKLKWTVIVAQDEGVFSLALSRTLNAWIATIILILVLTVFFAFYRAKAFSKLFEKLSQQARKVAHGEYRSEIEVSKINEFNELAQDIYQMVDAIEKREKSLQTKEAQLRYTLGSTPNVAIQWFDEKNRICYWNNASENIFGFREEDAKHKRLEHLILAPREAAEFNNCLNKVRQGEQVSQSFELNFHDKSGKAGEMIGSIFCIPNPDEHPIAVCMAVDITLQRRAENHIRRLNLELEQRVEVRTVELQNTNDKLQTALDNLNATMSQLVQAEKLAALGSLVAGISHELNTPIGNALMAATTLQDFSREIQNQFETGTIRKSSLETYLIDANSAAQITRRNLEKASELISSFKQVAVDQSSSQRRVFRLLELVDEILMTLKPVIRRSAVNIRVTIDPEIILDSYPGPLGQIISNLINNALIHGFDEGVPGEVLILATQSSQQVKLMVRDNGKGISKESIPKLFEPFFTTRLGQGGSGLGLHIVHNLVTELFGGQIRVDSIEGEGTTFTILLNQNAPSTAVVTDSIQQ